MRVLWLTNTISLHEPVNENKKKGHHGGGWITSAQRLLMANSDITLGVAFQMKGQPRKCVQDGGMGYLVPANCIAGGNPARVIRKGEG